MNRDRELAYESCRYALMIAAVAWVAYLLDVIIRVAS